jgi:hypothetical protein
LKKSFAFRERSVTLYKNYKMTYTNRNIISTYSGLFEGLSTISKIELIELLTKSLKKQVTDKEKDFFQSFGAFTTEKNADEMIAEIKKSRKFTQKDLEF